MRDTRNKWEREQKESSNRAETDTRKKIEEAIKVERKRWDDREKEKWEKERCTAKKMECDMRRKWERELKESWTREKETETKTQVKELRSKVLDLETALRIAKGERKTPREERGEEKSKTDQMDRRGKKDNRGDRIDKGQVKTTERTVERESSQERTRVERTTSDRQRGWGKEERHCKGQMRTGNQGSNSQEHQPNDIIRRQEMDQETNRARKRRNEGSPTYGQEKRRHETDNRKRLEVRTGQGHMDNKEEDFPLIPYNRCDRVLFGGDSLISKIAGDQGLNTGIQGRMAVNAETGWYS